MNSKRVAKNSVVLLLRMLALMLVNLYCVRVLLSRLGMEDYGVFNAVAGVVTSLSFLSSVFSLATQRFFSYLAGKGEHDRQRQVFTASMLLILAVVAVVVVVFETGGVWFLNHCMSIPAGREFAANCIAQFSLFVFVCSLAQTPYMAAIIANEDMGWYAAISAAEVVLRLVVALLIGVVAVDNLVFYGGGLLVVALLVLGTYVLLGSRSYSECTYVRVTDCRVYRQLMSFSGWVMYGSIANVGLIQGTVILLNVFFGPVVNAAFGIAMQIYSAMGSLCNTVMVAMRPAMIRLYAEGDAQQLMRMFRLSNKFVFAMIACAAVPLYAEMDFVLRIWLGMTSHDTVLFARMMLVYILVIQLHTPITIMIHATGNLRRYHLSVETVALMCVPATLMAFWMGAPSYAAITSMIVLATAAHAVRVWCMRRFFTDFSVMRYLLGFCLRAAVVACIVCGAVGYVCSIVEPSWGRLSAVAALSVALVCSMMYIVGLEREERNAVKQFIISQIHRRP